MTTVTLSLLPWASASLTRAFGGGGLIASPNDARSRRRRPSRSTHRCRQQAIAIGELKPADVGFDLAVVPAQEVGQCIALAMVANLFWAMYPASARAWATAWSLVNSLILPPR